MAVLAINRRRRRGHVNGSRGHTARHSGLRVLGLSGITNTLSGEVSPYAPPPDHEEVLEAGKILAPRLEQVIRGVLRRVMSVILEWFSRQVIWISVVCLIGAVGYLASAIIAKRQRDTAQFHPGARGLPAAHGPRCVRRAPLPDFGGLIFAVSVMWIPPAAVEGTGRRTPSSGLFTVTPAPRGRSRPWAPPA